MANNPDALIELIGFDIRQLERAELVQRLPGIVKVLVEKQAALNARDRQLAIAGRQAVRAYHSALSETIPNPGLIREESLSERSGYRSLVPLAAEI